MKICIKCKKTKSLKQFHNNKSCKNGKRGACIDCQNKIIKKIRGNPGHCKTCGLDKENMNTINKCTECYDIVIKKYTDSISNTQGHCKKCGKIKDKMRSKNKCRDCHLEEYRKKCHEIKQTPGNCKLCHGEQVKMQTRNTCRQCFYDKRNKSRKTEQQKKRRRKYRNKRYSEDICFKIKHNLRGRIRTVLKNNTKSSTTIRLLGCDIEFFIEYIQSQFTEKMTWDNHSIHGWHIDHIIPCASFDLSDPEQQKKCFHYTNLQPLWCQENWEKGSKTDI